MVLIVGKRKWSEYSFFLAYFFGEKPEDRTGDDLAKLTELYLSNFPSDGWSTWIHMIVNVLELN